jgi:branched-chain amino acid transport system substrate-binding protein
VISEWYESDDKVIKPMVESAAKKYADEKKLPVRDCSKES